MLVSIVSPDRANYWSHIGFWRSKEVRDWQAFRGSSGLVSSAKYCYSARLFLISWLPEACLLECVYPYLVNFQNEGLTVVGLQKHVHWSEFLLIIWTGLKLVLMVTYFCGSNNQSFSKIVGTFEFSSLCHAVLCSFQASGSDFLMLLALECFITPKSHLTIGSSFECAIYFLRGSWYTICLSPPSRMQTLRGQGFSSPFVHWYVPYLEKCLEYNRCSINIFCLLDGLILESYWT